MAISEGNKYLYSVAQDGKSGGVAAYEINGATGELTFIDSQVQEGAPPCHVGIHKNELVAPETIMRERLIFIQLMDRAEWILHHLFSNMKELAHTSAKKNPMSTIQRIRLMANM